MSMRKLFPLALSVLLSPGLAAAQSEHFAHEVPQSVDVPAAGLTVPIRMEKGRPVVEVTINGKGPYSFVLDTGAGGTVLSAELVRELALPVVGEVQIGDPIHPQGITAKQVRIEKLGIGAATFTGMMGTAMERSGFEEHLGARGVLGMPVFSDLLLTLRVAGPEIRIARGKLPDPDGRRVVALQPGHGIRVPITVGSIELVADLDSGSPAGLSLPEKYMDSLPLEGKPVEVGHAKTVTADFVVYGATLKGAVLIAGYRLENPTLRFNALPVANIGSDLLKRYTVTIDQKSGRIEFLEESPALSSDAGNRAERTVAS